MVRRGAAVSKPLVLAIGEVLPQRGLLRVTRGVVDQLLLKQLLLSCRI